MHRERTFAAFWTIPRETLRSEAAAVWEVAQI